MPVIALTQEMGSLAKDVAMRLGELAKLSVMRNEVVDNVAGRMQVPASLIRRVREGKAGFVERLSTDREQVALYSAEEVLAQAERGNVVLRGWGATCLLRPVQHVVRVRVTRPFEQRLAWLMEHLGTAVRFTPSPRWGVWGPGSWPPPRRDGCRVRPSCCWERCMRSRSPSAGPG